MSVLLGDENIIFILKEDSSGKRGLLEENNGCRTLWVLPSSQDFQISNLAQHFFVSICCYTTVTHTARWKRHKRVKTVVIIKEINERVITVVVMCLGFPPFTDLSLIIEICNYWEVSKRRNNHVLFAFMCFLCKLNDTHRGM